MRIECDIGVLGYPLPYYKFDQWPGHGVTDPTEIALRKGIVTRHLGAQVETYPQLHCSGFDQILLEGREEIAERTLATTEQAMHVLRLWCHSRWTDLDGHFPGKDRRRQVCV
jgi:hypothetical protein